MCSARTARTCFLVCTGLAILATVTMFFFDPDVITASTTTANRLTNPQPLVPSNKLLFGFELVVPLTFFTISAGIFYQFSETRKKKNQKNGWAKDKAAKQSIMTTLMILLLIPTVVIQYAVLEAKHFSPATENFTAVQECAEEDISLKFRNVGVCNAVADGYHCTPYFEGYWPTDIICSPDGFVDLVDTCEQPKGINCQKFRDQTPTAWLDGFGIAAGIVFLLTSIFEKLDWVFRIGKKEPDSAPWCCGISVRGMRYLFVNVTLIIMILFMFLGTVSVFSRRSALRFMPSPVAIYNTYFYPCFVLLIWMAGLYDHVNSFYADSWIDSWNSVCRYTILEKLFDTYAEDFSNDPTKATEATAKYWTPASTARLLDQVKSSISFPDRDEAVQLDGYQLTQYMADGYKRREYSNSAEMLQVARASDRKDAAVRWTLEQQNSNDTNSTTIAMPTNEDDRVARIKKEMEAVRAMFKSVDTDEDGKVSKEELAAKLETDAELRELIEDAGLATDFYVLEQIDTDKDKHISLDEFEEAIIVDGKWTTDSLNRGIFAFVCAIKSMPAKFEAYRNPKMPAGSLTFSEVWNATWGSMLTDADLKNKHGQRWWELGADKQNLATSAAPAAPDGNADFGFAEPDIIMFDGNDTDGSNADGGDNVQF